MLITIKIEGLTSFSQLRTEKVRQVIDAGEKVTLKHANIIMNSTISKIHNRTGEMASLLKSKIDGKGGTFVVAHMGTLGATKEQAIDWNSYEYGHAAPNNAGGVKVVIGSAVMRSSADEDKSAYKNDMKTEIKRIIES